MKCLITFAVIQSTMSCFPFKPQYKYNLFSQYIITNDFSHFICHIKHIEPSSHQLFHWIINIETILFEYIYG